MMTERLNSLLRGEIAAAETYTQALDGLGERQEAEPLRAIRQQHGNAIRFLCDQIESRGGEPASSSGIQGAFVRAAEGTAKVPGNNAALSALRRGEIQGLQDYERALTDVLPPECRFYIEENAIPQQHMHIDTLTRLIEQA